MSHSSPLRSFRPSAAVLTLCACLTAAGLAEARTPDADAEEPVLALTGARILTQTEAGVIAEGTVLIRGGAIEAVGADVEVPDEAETLDLAGWTLSPGLIDARSVLGLTPAAQNESANDGGLNILDAVDPYDNDWPEVLRAGVTAVAVTPGRDGLLGGRGAVIAVVPGGALEDRVLKADAFVQAALGLGRDGANAILRHQQYERLKRVFDGVKKYKEEWEEYEKALKEYEDAQAKKKKEAKKKEGQEADADKDKENDESDSKDEEKDEDDGDEEDDENGDDRPRRGGRGERPQPSPDRNDAQDDDDEEDGDDEEDDEDNGDEADKDDDEEKKDDKAPDEPPKKPKRDLTKGFLVQVIEGEVPLRIEAHREDDLEHAFELAEEFGITLIVEGMSDPRSAVQELTRQRTPMVLGPILKPEPEDESLPDIIERRGPHWPAGIVVDDSRWAIGTYGTNPQDSALLRAQAAAAVARGIPEDQALEAITSGAAEVLGVADRIGALKEGLRADLVAFGGDPLDPSSPVGLVVSAGEVVYRDLDRFEPEADPRPAVSVIDPELPERLPSRFLIRGARLLQPDGSVAEGSFLVVDGRIADPDEARDGDREIDLGDAVVTPGLITSWSRLGQDEALSESAGADASLLRAVDVFDPNGKTARRLVQGGVLRAGFAPVSANVIAGSVGTLRLGALDAVFEPDLGTLFVLTEAARRADRFPASLPGQIALIRQFLTAPETGADLEPPTRDLEYELPARVLRRFEQDRRALATGLRQGERRVFFEVERPAEIEAALTLIDDYDLNGALVGPGDIGPFVDRLKALDVGLILTPRPPDPETTRRLRSAVAAAAEGIPLALAADDPERLRLLDARLVAEGLPRETALQALTVGLDESPSSWFEPGRPADFVIWDGAPMDLRHRPLGVVVEGRFVPAAP